MAVLLVQQYGFASGYLGLPLDRKREKTLRQRVGERKCGWWTFWARKLYTGVVLGLTWLLVYKTE